MLHYKGEVLMADIRDEIDLCEGIEFNNEDNKEEQVKETWLFCKKRYKNFKQSSQKGTQSSMQVKTT